MSKRAWFWGGVSIACLVLLVGALYWWIDNTSAGTPKPRANAQKPGSDPLAISVEPQPLEKIPPGTVIGDKVPEGWTHLLFHCQPDVTEEDRQQAPRAVPYMQMFKYVILAKVQKSKNSHILKAVEVGFAIDIKGKETVIDSTDTQDAELGAFGKPLLVENEKGLDKDVRQMVQTPTLRIIDDRQYFLRGTEHVKLPLRYAIVVLPKTGRLWTFVWLVSDQDKENPLPEKEMHLLRDGLREKYRMSINRDRLGFLGLSPSEDAFARKEIPPGKAIPFTPPLRKLAGLKEFTREQALELEKALLEAGLAAG